MTTFYQKKSKDWMISLVNFTLLSLAVASYGLGLASAQQSSDFFRFAFIPKATNIPFFFPVREGAEARADFYGQSKVGLSICTNNVIQ